MRSDVRAWLLAVCALLAACTAHSALGQVRTRADWAEQPSPEDMADLFPRLASYLRVSGRALITCGVQATSVMTDCRVRTETPTGFGFGRAAIELAYTRAKMKPELVDGQPTNNGEVTIPINFVFPETEPDPVRPTEPKPKSAAVRALAEVAAERDGGYGAVHEAYGAVVRNVEVMAAEADSETRDIAVRHVRQLARQHRDAMRPSVAAVYAEALSTTALRQLAERDISVPGLKSGLPEAAQRRAEAFWIADTVILVRELRAAVCAEVSCEMSAPTAAPSSPSPPGPR